MKIKDDVIKIRRKIHMEPELGFEEHSTQRLVIEELERVGIRCKSIAGTGVIAEIGEGKPAIGIRADMDALPLEEKTNLPFSSKKKNVMHACGHDAHVAMLIGAAWVLKDLNFEGTVRLIFQPAEEGLNGAKKVIEEGGIDGLNGIEAIHVWSMLPKGVIGVREGAFLASVDRFIARVIGKGGHGSMPHQTQDPITASVAYIQSLNTIVSRRISPLNPSVLSVCRIAGGSTFNIIPDEVLIEGTIRSLDEDTRETIHRLMREYGNVCRAYGCEVELTIERINDATVNDRELVKLALEVGKKISEVHEVQPMMGGEDFSEYSKKIPGLIVLLGMGTNIPHHSPYFIVDEDILPIGIAFHVNFALEFLKRYEKG